MPRDYIRSVNNPIGHDRMVNKKKEMELTQRNFDRLKRRLESALNAFKDLAFGHPKTNKEIKEIVDLQIIMISKELAEV